MKKGILVATDASPVSNRAVVAAAEMAARFDVKLVILHVVRDMQLPAEVQQMAEVEKIVGARQEVLEYVGQRILKEAEERAEQAGAEEVETKLGDGDPASAIVNMAKANGVDLVVIGTRGLGDLKGMFMGSVSRKVTNICEVNCLVVR